MARITIEDCLPFVDNRFDLVITASAVDDMINLTSTNPAATLQKFANYDAAGDAVNGTERELAAAGMDRLRLHGIYDLMLNAPWAL